MSLQTTLFNNTDRSQQFSVAIMPPENIIQEIRLLKKKLQEAIGWYHSCNSDAHITFNLFRCNEAGLAKWTAYIKDFAWQLRPAAFRFDTVAVFHSRAFVILPDDISRSALIPVMRSFHKNSPGNHFGKSVNPHISIGRKLSPDQMEAAKQLIPSVEISFTCDNLILRKLNNEKSQYEVCQRFYFGHNEPEVYS